MRVSRLRLGGRLDRYLFRQHLASLAYSALAILGIFSLFDLTLHLDLYGSTLESGERVGLAYLLRYELLQLPFLFLRTAPLITLLSGLVTLARTLRSNEWIAAVNTGVRPQRLLAPFLFVGVLVGASMVGIDRYLIPLLAHQRQLAWQGVTGKLDETEVADVWVRDKGGIPVHIDVYRGDPRGGASCTLEGVEAAYRDDEGWHQLAARSASYRGTLEQGEWVFQGGRVRSLEAGGRTWRDVDPGEVLRLSPSSIQSSVKAVSHPLELTRQEVNELLRRDPANLSLRTLRQSNRAFPLANLVLLLVGLPLVLAAGGRLAWRGVVAAFVLGFLFFLIDSVTRSMGMEGQLGPLVAAWFPLLLYGSAGVVLTATARS